MAMYRLQSIVVLQFLANFLVLIFNIDFWASIAISSLVTLKNMVSPSSASKIPMNCGKKFFV